MFLPRNRREGIFLVLILMLAGFFLYRIAQFKSFGPASNHITAVLSTTRGEHDSVVTEVFIDSSEDRFQRSRRQGASIGNLGARGRSDGTASKKSFSNAAGSTIVLRDGALQHPESQGTQGKAADSWAVDKPRDIGIGSSLRGQGSDSKAAIQAANADGTVQQRPEVKQRPDEDLILPKQVNLGHKKPQQQQQGQGLRQERPLSVKEQPEPLQVAERPKKQQTPGKPGLPLDFDWQTYLLYNPELQQAGLTTQSLAEQHYTSQGRAMGLIYKRLRVLLRYTACTGLINQHYSHIAAFSLSAVLGAELVLPPAVKRDSFAHYFSVFKEHNEVKWTPAPLESLLNVDKLIDFWKNRGLTVHRTPGLHPFPDLTQPEVAFPLFHQADIDPNMVTHMEDVYLRNLDMPELIEKARLAVVGHASKLLQADPDREISYIVLDLPCTFFMLRSLSNLRVVTEVARSLEFSSYVTSLADRIIHGMTKGGQLEYNAVHLRIEKDARDWSQIMGGEQVVWHGYVQSMRQALFSPDLGLYVASGLLTYGANDDMDHIIETLKDFGLCNEVHYKELYVPQAELDALNSEQKALVDFLVLSRGRGFVGFGSSTFSFYLREFRVLNGIPRSSSVLVDASVIGTDPLFHSAGTVI